MSGGRFDYIDSRCKEEIFGWSAEKPINVFEDREISELIFDVFDLIHAYDWYASGDTCEDTYLKAKAEFKKKWLKRDDSRVRMIIDNAIDEVREELYKTYGVPQTERSCTNCKHNGVLSVPKCDECHNMDKHEFIKPQTDCPWK